jgi:hypothetical protein
MKLHKNKYTVYCIANFARAPSAGKVGRSHVKWRRQILNTEEIPRKLTVQYGDGTCCKYVCKQINTGMFTPPKLFGNIL